ncbi:MAG: hypothetical protein ACRDSF_00170 [Pseudonocardiaceae bacterium]
MTKIVQSAEMVQNFVNTLQRPEHFGNDDNVIMQHAIDHPPFWVTDCDQFITDVADTLS